MQHPAAFGDAVHSLDRALCRIADIVSLRRVALLYKLFFDSKAYRPSYAVESLHCSISVKPLMKFAFVG